MAKKDEIRPAREAGSKPASLRAFRAGEVAASQRRRDGLTRVMDRHGLTPTELAHLAGYTTPNFLFNLLHGHSNALSIGAVERILTVLPTVSFEELVGWTSRDGTLRPDPATIRPGMKRDRRKVKSDGA